MQTTSNQVIEQQSQKQKPRRPVAQIAKLVVGGWEHSPHLYQRLNTVIENMKVLQKKGAIDSLYVIHQLGIAWRGRINSIVKADKSHIYGVVKELLLAGYIDPVDLDHPEVKAQLYTEKHRVKTFSKASVTEAYTIAEDFVDELSDLWIDEPQVVNRGVREEVSRQLDRLSAIKMQQAEIRKHTEKYTCVVCNEIKSDNSHAWSKEEGVCKMCYGTAEWLKHLNDKKRKEQER